MENSDLDLLKTYLSNALEADNELRKQAESQLKDVRNANPENYCLYMFEVVCDTQTPSKVRVLAAVLLRRVFLSSLNKEENYWVKLELSNRTKIQENCLELIKVEQDESVVNSIAELLSEIIGTMYEIESQVWMEDPHNVCKTFIESQSDTHISAALKIYIGMFDKIYEPMLEYKEDLLKVFEVTLSHTNLEISYLGMKACCKIVNMLERKDAQYFVPCLKGIMDTTMRAFKADDEDILDKCLIEIKELAGVEPKFFTSEFELVFDVCIQIMNNKDYDKKTIRMMPIEFISTIIVRLKSIFKKNIPVVKKVIEAIYNVMVDLDDDTDYFDATTGQYDEQKLLEVYQEWLYPEDGCKIEEEEFSVDPAHVGSKCIDSFIREIGKKSILPLVKNLIYEGLQSQTDWKHKNASLMLLALLGEYIENIFDSEELVKAATNMFSHGHPKVRYAAYHAVGQMSTDLQPAFQAHYNTILLEKMIAGLDDKYPRLQAHMCASLTNFLEGATDDIVEDYIEGMVTKLLNLIKEGTTMCKENAVTCLATVAEAAEDRFIDYFEPTIKEVAPFLTAQLDPKYYQFKGQLIETIVIISVSVGLDVFREHAQELIKILLGIQNAIFEETGTYDNCVVGQKTEEHHVLQSYLLTAWEKLCYLMMEEFVPYLNEIMPTLLRVASLNPEFKTSEKETLIDEQDDKKNNLVTSEVEEKTAAIQMMEAFVHELKGHFAPFVEPATQIILPMISYKNSESIRTSSVKCIDGLMTAVVEGDPSNRDLHTKVAMQYIDALWHAMKKEQETETLGYECKAVKEIITVLKTPFMDENAVEEICRECLLMLHASDKRKKINEDYMDENVVTQGDHVDEEDVELMDQENYNEDEFQIAITEIFGALFKTHKQYCGKLIETLFKDMIPVYLEPSAPFIKHKFALYITCDMIENLGYDTIKDQFKYIMEQLMIYSQDETTVLRQSACYTIGVASLCCHFAFKEYVSDCIELMKKAVLIEQGDQDKEEYLHCRDNAISTIGKIIKNYREEDSDGEFLHLFLFWLSNMPLKRDTDECKEMNQFLAEELSNYPDLVLGETNERLPFIIELLGEQLHEIYMHEKTIVQYGMIIIELQKDDKRKAIINQSKNQLDKLHRKRINKAVELAKKAQKDTN